MISRIIDSFFSGASLGTKSRAEIAVLKAFLASVWLPNCVKQDPFLWCSLCARFFGYLYLKANSISWRQSTVTRYYRFGTQTSNTHTLKIIIFYYMSYQNYQQSRHKLGTFLVTKAFLKFKFPLICNNENYFENLWGVVNNFGMSELDIHRLKKFQAQLAQKILNCN